MRRSGFTLIEVLAASALLTAALGMIWHAWFSAQHTTEVLGRKMTATESTVHAMALLRRDLRQASRASVSELPSATLTFRTVSDENGDGLPIDVSGAPELSGEYRVTRDHEDANGDGLGAKQLVFIGPGGIRVLANALVPKSESDVVDPGVWFEGDGSSISVYIGVQEKTRRKLVVGATLVDTVVPRNL